MEGWKFNGRETVSIVSIVVVIVLWSYGTFLTKDEADRRSKARDEREALTIQQVRDANHRMDGIEGKVDKAVADIGGVKADTSYIRGRIEPHK